MAIGRAAGVAALYGLILSFFSATAAAAGHGTYIPMALFCSPMTLAGIGPALFGAPFIWSVIGAAAAGASPSKRVAALLLVCHYAAAFAGWAGLLLKDFGDWPFVARRLGDFVLYVPLVGGAYIAGQVWLWRRIRS